MNTSFQRGKCSSYEILEKPPMPSRSAPLATVSTKTETVRRAISLGMPLNEIEAKLDWLDAIRPGCKPDT